MTEARKASGFRASLPVTIEVLESRQENERMFTVYFRRPPDEEGAARRGLKLAAFEPGRFFMVWIPRLGEKPYAVSYLDGKRVGMMVQVRGPFSTRLAGVGPGDRVGLRGPFGRGFWDVSRHADSGRVAVVGGGCGMAVLAPLIRRLPKARIVQGARAAEGILYRDLFSKQVIFTDDGSAGRQGFPTEWLEEQVAGGALDMVYTCGPEVMMAMVAETCRDAGIDCQVCMERYMKCGIGVCGQCECDGRRVCEEGPVFGLEELGRMPSFGAVRRDKAGRRIQVVAAEHCPSGPRRIPPEESR